MTAIDLEQALMQRYPKGEYAFFSQVRNCTGFAKQIRTADSMVLSLWPSRGLQLSGFELKVSKSDWKRELEQPEKADGLVAYCDAWWVVTPLGVVDKGDLPPTWGLLEWTGEKWKTTNPRRPLKPKALDREFVASLVRNFAEGMVPQTQVEQLAAVKLEQAMKDRDRGHQYDRQRVEILERQIRDFEAAAGFKITESWNPSHDVGLIVKSVLRGEHSRVPDKLRHLRSAAENILQSIDRELAIAQVPAEVKRG